MWEEKYNYGKGKKAPAKNNQSAIRQPPPDRMKSEIMGIYQIEMDHDFKDPNGSKIVNNSGNRNTWGAGNLYSGQAQLYPDLNINEKKETKLMDLFGSSGTSVIIKYFNPSVISTLGCARI